MTDSPLGPAAGQPHSLPAAGQPGPLPADDPAVLARTAVDCARVASLVTYGRATSAAHVTTVAVRPRADGGLDALVSPASLAVRQLLARPVATVRVAPAGCEPVVLHGSAHRHRGRGEGRLVFHVEAAAVRVGRPAQLVDEARYAAAAPDPLRHDAPAVLAHLNAGHRAALTACLRARGCAADFTEAVRLDAEGLTVLAVGPAGVDTVRLRFGTPVSRLSQLPAGLHAVLAPSCRCPHSST